MFIFNIDEKNSEKVILGQLKIVDEVPGFPDSLNQNRFRTQKRFNLGCLVQIRKYLEIKSHTFNVYLILYNHKISKIVPKILKRKFLTLRDGNYL